MNSPVAIGGRVGGRGGVKLHIFKSFLYILTQYWKEMFFFGWKGGGKALRAIPTWSGALILCANIELRKQLQTRKRTAVLTEKAYHWNKSAHNVTVNLQPYRNCKTYIRFDISHQTNENLMVFMHTTKNSQIEVRREVDVTSYFLSILPHVWTFWRKLRSFKTTTSSSTNFDQSPPSSYPSTPAISRCIPCTTKTSVWKVTHHIVQNTTSRTRCSASCFERFERSR